MRTVELADSTDGINVINTRCHERKEMTQVLDIFKYTVVNVHMHA